MLAKNSFTESTAVCIFSLSVKKKLLKPSSIFVHNSDAHSLSLSHSSRNSSFSSVQRCLKIFFVLIQYASQALRTSPVSSSTKTPCSSACLEACPITSLYVFSAFSTVFSYCSSAASTAFFFSSSVKVVDSIAVAIKASLSSSAPLIVLSLASLLSFNSFSYVSLFIASFLLHSLCMITSCSFSFSHRVCTTVSLDSSCSFSILPSSSSVRYPLSSMPLSIILNISS